MMRWQFKDAHEEIYNQQERDGIRSTIRVIILTAAGAIGILGLKAYTDDEFRIKVESITEKIKGGFHSDTDKSQ